MAKKILFTVLVCVLISCKPTIKPLPEEKLSKDSLGKNEFDANESEKLPINNLKVSEDSFINPTADNEKLLEGYKKIISDLEKIRSDASRIELYAKMVKSDSLIKVPNNDSWPEDTEISYNLLRGSNGGIVYFAEYPMSESGDWSIGYRYYFNDKGNTIIFIRESNFFNSECTDGVAKELSCYSFDSSFNLIAKDYELKSSDGKNLVNSRCYFPYHYEYIIESNSNELISKLKIKM